MNLKQDTIRAKELRTELQHHNTLYYINAQPVISDNEYDKLYRELIDIETAHPELITADTPTQRVGGAALSQFNHIQHRQPMMSLDNTYNKDELIDFDQRLQRLIDNNDFSYVVEPKIDGLAISLRYENGILISASTRGDGKTGDDITANIKTIHSIPLRLNSDTPPRVFEVRGEVYMPTEGFRNINNKRQEAGLEPFANPRNAAAGSLKLLDPRIVAERPLDAVLYALGETEGINITTHTALITTLAEFGFRTAPLYWHCDSIENVITDLDKLETKRHSFPFEIDGGVIKIDERELYKTVGATAKAPRWAIAYKYEPEQAETTINQITVQVGRTGVLTPVAELEPVTVAGSTISRATLHNIEEIRRKDIRIGDRVIVEKAGEVIPAIVEVITKHRTGKEEEFSMPDRCPVCNGAITQRENEVASRCENLQCPAQIKRWIRHFAARGAMNIDGLGSSLVEQLVDKKITLTPADLYELTVNQLAQLDRMARKSAENIYQAIDASKNRDFWRVLFALGIRQVGARSAQLLEEHYTDIESLTAANSEELEEIPDIGPIVAQNIIEFLNNNHNIEMIAKLKQAGLNLKRKVATAESDTLTGQTFVLTGTLHNMTRDEAAEKIRALGGKTSSSISKNTTFLIAGDNAGSKLTKAEDLGVAILTETEFSTQILQSETTQPKTPPMPIQGELF
ncbi:MAG: NAD-dependent DNA ligase LigA [Kiritimatiellae bacterium]|nr:NAD-dependent DNA ligase LigA [Kiritimatiellia bacterium]